MKSSIMTGWLICSALVTLGTVINLGAKGERTSEQMCEEVRIEVQSQVDAGMLERAYANNLVERCFTLFIQ